MLINKAAQRYGITVRTIRYYEELGLLSLDRNNSNVRYLSEEQLQCLEEILLLKMFNINLSDIKSILQSKDTSMLKSLLHDELTTLNTTVKELTHKQQLIRSLLKTYGSSDISKQNLHEFINEQLYFKNERLIKMITSAENLSLEIGENLIPDFNQNDNPPLIKAVKSLRQSLNMDHNISLATVHIKDNLDDLNPNEFQIKQNDAVLLRDTAPEDNIKKQVEFIIARLSTLLTNN